MSVFFNASTPYEATHMILAAYMVTGFVVAGVYAVGLLRGRRDRYHRLGFGVPFTIAGIAAPLQVMMGDVIARFIAHNQPVKFAAMEYVLTTQKDAPEWLGGILINGKIYFGVSIPAFDSILVGFNPHTQVVGLNSAPAALEPPLDTLIHLSFNLMVGIGFFLFALAAWQGWWWWFHRRVLMTAWFLVPAACQRRRRGGGDGGGLGRHRGRPAALDRVPGPAGQHRRHPVERGHGHAGGDPGPVRDPDRGLDRRSDADVTAMAARGARRGGRRAGAVRPVGRRGGGWGFGGLGALGRLGASRAEPRAPVGGAEAP